MESAFPDLREKLDFASGFQQSGRISPPAVHDSSGRGGFFTHRACVCRMGIMEREVNGWISDGMNGKN